MLQTGATDADLRQTPPSSAYSILSDWAVLEENLTWMWFSCQFVFDLGATEGFQ